MSLSLGPSGDTLLTGAVKDQSALHGVLNKIRDLNMEIVSVELLDDGGSYDTRRRWLYILGGIAALAAALCFRRNMDAEMTLAKSLGLFNAIPAAAPRAVTDWYALLQEHALCGLVFLGFFDMINYALVGFFFLGLVAALRRGAGSFLALAAALAGIGIAAYFASNQIFSLLSLSRGYAAAATQAERAAFIAAGQAALAIHENVTFGGIGINASFFLVSAAGLLIAAVMLISETFGKAAAYAGILANATGLSYYILLACAPAFVFIPLSVSAVFLMLWYILSGIRLLRLGCGRHLQKRSGADFQK